VISGFTIVRNAVRLDYPIVPAIRSILDICDEVVVNVGKSDDDTRDLVSAIDDPRLRILDTVWDVSQHGGGRQPTQPDARDRDAAGIGRLPGTLGSLHPGR